MGDHRLTVAEWLLEAGAGRSALFVLGELLGQRANEVRRLSLDVALAKRTVHALVTLEDGRGAVVPLIPSPGRSRAKDPELRIACDRALKAVREILGTPSLPALRFELEDWLSLFGASLGLPAALAFLGYYAPSRLPARAVLATGRLLDGGALAAVDGMQAKSAIAELERGEKLVVTPEIGSLSHAVCAVFGDAPMVPERRVLTLDQTIERARSEPDRGRAIAELEALPDSLAKSDAARVLLELGTLYRHEGDSDRAAALHARAKEMLDRERRFIGADAAERYELECRLSAMDAFQIDEAIEALTHRLDAPFLSAHNEVRCRGMLAQALGMAGRHAEAVSVRIANVELQSSSDALRAVLPGTYCYLALDSAKAGDAPGFDRWAELLRSTPQGNDHQWRFNAAAIGRGLVALGRHREALEWVPKGDHAIASHPETSLVRALCRAYKRSRAPAEAKALAARVPIPSDPSNLVAWLCALVHLEANPTKELQAELTALHPPATRFHQDLVSSTGADLERALDRVWY
jgi:hypothetical protein